MRTVLTQAPYNDHSEGPRSSEANRVRVAMLQRAIAHYRLPLFEKLAQGPFEWTFFAADYDQSFATGLPTDLSKLTVRSTRNRRLLGPLIYQTGLKLRGVDAFVFDMGWTLLSNPRYLLEAKMRGVATIGWSKGIPQDASRKTSRLKSFYQKSITSLCDAILVYGQVSRDFFLDLGYPADRIFVAQNTIDTVQIAKNVPQAKSDCSALARSLGVSGRFVFGYLGALIERKKVDQIIASFEVVREKGLDAVLIIAGGGSHEGVLKEVARNSKFREDIRIVGRVPVGGELAYFQLFDAYLTFAQGGLGILEAMAAGRLVISTPEKYPETEHLVDHETALISNDFSTQGFAEAMAEAVTARQKNQVYGNNAQERVLERATLEKMADSIRQAIEYSIKSKTKSS